MLDSLLASQAAYRGRQVRKALFGELAEDWGQVSVLPKELRGQLTAQCPIGIEAEVSRTADGRSEKALITLHDGRRVECVLMRHGDGRNTVCVSSQVGCPLDCTFCATGRIGFERNLDAWEIVEQVVLFARRLKAGGDKVTNVVFMGMGEPFLNYDNVIGAVRMLNDPEGLALGARRISISTVGVVDGIRRLAGEGVQVNLAVSLNGPDDGVRRRIMPAGRKYPVAAVMEAVDEYVRATGRRVMFEYIMIKGVNDSDACARSLVKLLKGRLCMVNLIAYNATGEFAPSDTIRIKAFRSILEAGGLGVTQRYRFGGQIHGACGQLAGKRRDEGA